MQMTCEKKKENKFKKIKRLVLFVYKFRKRHFLFETVFGESIFFLCQARYSHAHKTYVNRRRGEEEEWRGGRGGRGGKRTGDSRKRITRL